MDDVKRYKKHGEILGRVLVSAQDGDYVKYADYAALQARTKEAVETLRKGFKSCDPTKTAAAIILAIAQLEGHGE